MSQFLSATSNVRDDDYSGTFANRMRFGLEILDAIRREVGRDVAVDVRLNGRDFVSGGIEIPDAIAFAQALVAHGADSLNVSGGPHHGPRNIHFPEEAAKAIAPGCCDLVGVARAVMADPDCARKALGG